MIAAWRVREDRAGGANRHQPRHGALGVRVQELCQSRGGRPGLPILMSLTVSVDVKQH